MPPVEGTVHADLQGHTRRVSTVCLATDAHHALSASLDRTLRLWEVPSGRCLRVLEGHGSDVNAAALSRDGRWALSGSGEVVTGEMLLRLWDLGTGTAVRDFVGHEAEVSAAAFRGDGALAASGSADATVRLWDVASGGCRHVLKGHGGWSGRSRSRPRATRSSPAAWTTRSASGTWRAEAASACSRDMATTSTA